MTFKPSEFNDKLEKAVDTYDRDGSAKLCDELLSHLRERDDSYPLKHAKTILGLLRNRRYFDLMEAVADTLIQNEQEGARVYRMYAQALLDQGHLTSGIYILRSLAERTAEGGEFPDPDEHAEALGLLGRAYKDLYVLGRNPSRSRNRKFLEKAIRYYKEIYDDNKQMIWQGINAVALIRRADSDGIELKDVAGAELMANSMATEILAEVKGRRQNKKADTWDYATGLEACVGLQRHDEALEWLTRYLKSDYTSAFELGSTYRQLTQVWQLNPGEPPGDRILPALKAALLEQEGSEIEIGIKEANRESLDALGKDAGYEKILGTETFKSFKWFQRCMKRASAVVKIEDSFEDPVGTGFVVRGADLHPKLGEELLLLTNAHVISEDPDVSRALRPEKATARFELWKDGGSPSFKVHVIWSSPPEKLDATLLRPDPPIADVNPVPVTEILPVGEKQRAYIIGHPQGRKLSFSIHDNHLLDHDDRLLHYRSPTEPGNSGSPIFNDDWELIGLHHSGLAKMPKLNGQEGTYPANEGIWIKAIKSAIGNANID